MSLEGPIDRRQERVALITGAVGGLGSTVARLLGHTHVLVLTDGNAKKLEQFASSLNREGYRATALSGDLTDPVLHGILAEHCKRTGALRSIVNAAGLSPAQADWQTIVNVNTVAASQLVRTIEPLLTPGSACVMIASVAGHLGPVDAEIEALLDNPHRADLIDALEPLLKKLTAVHGGTVEGHAYSLSKRAVIRLCERQSLNWGKKRARIISISPGVLSTAMGRLEAKRGDRAQALINSTPAARWGNAMDVAKAAEFLLSDAASYITGSDFRVDGGAVAALRGQTF